MYFPQIIDKDKNKENQMFTIKACKKILFMESVKHEWDIILENHVWSYQL